LIGALAAMGLSLESPTEAPAALRGARAARWSRPVDPVTVAPGGRIEVRVRLPRRFARARIGWRLILEDGEERSRSRPERLDVAASGAVDGSGHVEAVLRIPENVPLGYHTLHLEGPTGPAETLVLAPPLRPPRDDGRRGWGIFLPLYALRSSRSWGVGDLTDLGDMAEWAGALGAETVATLPLLAAFLDEPFEPSPYSPASRLFWNELFLDVRAVPEMARSAEARALASSRSMKATVDQLRQLPLVDYRETMAAKRRVLAAVSRAFFARPEGPRWQAFRAFRASTPGLQDYARFRAACERRRSPWMAWPSRERAGRLPPEGGDPEAFRYHQYVQWLAAEQMDHVAGRARGSGLRLYVDMPLGVNPAGFDVWNERAAFAMGASTGAPPDPFFPNGQDWGFFPLHPERIREQRYRYPIACLRHVLRHAGALRIDHVMGMHRLYWVPAGLDATDGAYVRYAARELYAILDLEALRSGAMIVGEDLGTVQPQVRAAMARHGVLRSFVLPFEVTGGRRPRIRPAPRGSFAALDTHDMPPFAGSPPDVMARIRDALGRLGAKSLTTTRDVMDASLDHLAAGQARMVLVNLEDLWLEKAPQNVPGTVDEYPNWRRVARHPLERIRRMRSVVGTLRRVDAIRKGKTTP
jgi:4-alpha-glucanotransferase